MAASAWLGIGIAFVYDCLRIFRRVNVHTIFWISLEDLAYWVFVSCSVFRLLYYENDGSFRWFAVLGAGLGMLAYKKTLSVFFVNRVSAFFLWIKKLFGKWFTFASRPVRYVVRRAGEGVLLERRRLGRAGRLMKKRLTVQARLIKISVYRHWKKQGRTKKNDKKKNRR